MTEMKKLKTMKKLLLLLLCVPLIGLGQTWEYSDDGNDFDGNTRTASIVGNGDDYPYNSPNLLIYFFESNSHLNFCISDAGYYTKNSNTSVLLSFSNEKGNIYSAYDIHVNSGNSDLVFLSHQHGETFGLSNDTLVNNLEINVLEIFKKLMDASYVNIRISNDYGQNDIRFSLSGSTKGLLSMSFLILMNG